ncbi:MAG TPA: PKD-like domain-containing protein, partial [Niastella sp.]
NFNKASGIQTYSSANAAGISGGRFNGNIGTGTSTNTLQLLSDFAMNSSGSGTLTVNANATLDCGTRLVTSSGANFTLNAGGSIITANTQGLANGTATTGSIQVQGSRNFSNAANYTYNGTAAQIIGNAFTTAANLTINNAAGVTLTANTTVNGTLTLTNGLLTLGTSSLTIGAAGSISGGSSTAYVNTNNSGFLRRTVAASPVAFPVGTTAYNPITLTNTGTSDVYSIIETDGTVPNALDATFTVNRRWRVTENVSGGSNLAVVGQYNSGEAAANFNSGIIPKIGFYNGTVWTENAAIQAGAGPFTFTSNANFTPTNLTTGTQYFALGKDQAFTPIPQGTLTANSICEVGTGQLTFTATAGTAPFTVVYNDGTGNVTQNNVTSGTPFNVTPNPTVTTSYTLVSVTDNDGDVRSSGFTGGGTATITVNPAIANNTIAADQTICSGTTPAAMTGSVPTGGNGTYIFQWQSSTTSATTGFANAAGTSTGQNYTPPGNITQTTWYRRVVTSNGCTDNGTAIQVTITPAPTITPGPTLTATQSCAPVAITLTGASFTAPATSAAWSIVSGGGTLSTTALTASPATVTYTPASNFSGAVTLALTTDACPTLSATRTINVSLPTIVNYDFNTGNSFATLVSNAVPNITSTASGTSFATSATSTITGGNAFTVNSTAGNSLSQAAVANNNWTFTLTGNDVRFYKTFRVYFLGQRNSGTTGQNINILYSVDGGAFVSLGNLGLNNLGTWVESLLSLPVAADNPTSSIAIRLNINAGNGTTLIDNFQMQAIYTQPTDKTPVAAASLVCEGTGTNIQIPASQLGVNYQLRNNTGNVNIGSAIAGTGSTINLPTGNLTTATTFNVLASNSCSVQMANTVTVNVTPLATLSSSLTTPDICTNTAFSYTPTSTTSGATFNWSRAAVAGISNSAATGTGDPNETLINTTATPKSVTYAYTVTANGCTNPTAFNVVVVVNPSPALSSTLTPAAVCDGNPFQYIPTSATPGATFNWSRATVAGISNAPATGTDDPNETLFNLTADPINVTYVYSLSANGCANPTTYNVVVSIEPSATVSALDTVVSNTAGVCGASITLGNNVTTNGTLSFSIDGNPITMPHTFPIGTTNVTVTAENNCGTSTTFFDVTVNDTEAPAIPTLSNVTGECSATATAPVATDNCEGPITGTTTDPLTYSTQGNFVIHWSFDDGHGNISTATQNVIVQDVTAPAIPTLNDVTGECSATATAPVATDNCVGPITGTTTDPLTYTTQGTHTIHWSFDDGRGNISTATQNVVIEDVTPPAVPVLTNVTGECSATATAPTTTDNCSGTITGTTTDALTYSTQGTHVIHWSFDDGNGNISTANQNVVIEDV